MLKHLIPFILTVLLAFPLLADESLDIGLEEALEWDTARQVTIESEYPPDIRMIFDKMAGGEEITAADKSVLQSYFDSINRKNRINPVDSTWGPDGWGYIARDHTSGGQAFNWIDISTTGTEVWAGQNQDDAWSNSIALPFGFPFYGTVYNNVFINSNVLVAFDNSYSAYWATGVPTTNQPAKIDPFAYDMYHRDYSHYYYQGFGDSLFVVSFINASYYTEPSQNYSKDLQVLMWSDGKIKLQYDSVRTIYPGSPNPSGIEDEYGPYGLAVGQPYDDLAATFYYEPQFTGIEIANGTVSPALGSVSTNFEYSITYRSINGQAPDSAIVYVDGTSHAMTDPGGLYQHGVSFTYTTQLDTGLHDYCFRFVQGTHIDLFPAAGVLQGPQVFPPALSGSYDIGGGNNDFPDLISARNALYGSGIDGSVTFTVYPGVYNGLVMMEGPIVGNSAANTITFRSARGQPRAVLTNTLGGSLEGGAFFIAGPDYVTVEGFEIADCNGYGLCIRYTSTDTSHYCVIKDNYIRNVGVLGNYYGMYLYRAANVEVSGNEVDGDFYNIYLGYCDDAVVYNNMMYNTVSILSLSLYRCPGTKCYYNSIYSDYVSRAIYLGYPTDIDVRNNIIFNNAAGGHCLYALGGLPATSDYNCLYAPNGNVGYYSGPLNTLANWQAATNLDMNSISADPCFVDIQNQFDLHIRNYMQSPVSGAGTPLTEVTTDFDGEARHATAPDMGADEYDYYQASYAVDIRPEYLRRATTPGNSADYYYNIINIGSAADSYTLSVSGASWPTTIYDSSGTTVITSTGNLASLQNQWIMVSHSIPTGTPGGAVDVGNLVAASIGSPGVADTSDFATFCAALMGSFDVNGGGNDFATIIEAIDTLYAKGMAGACTINVYTGTYPGGVRIDYDLAGLGPNAPLVLRAADGQSPRITNLVTPGEGGIGIALISVTDVTIDGFEIDSTNSDAINCCMQAMDSCRNIVIRNCYAHNIGLEDTYPYAVWIANVPGGEFSGNEIDGSQYGVGISYCTGFLIANNMIYDQVNTSLRCYGDNNTVVYNSILMNSSYSSSNAGMFRSMFAGTIQNNIICNLSTGTNHRAVYHSSIAGTVCDYNCYWAPNGTFGYSGGAIANLAAWQSTTGYDSNSVESDPGFICTQIPYDLHLNDSSVCIGVGTPIAGITVDIDGDLRDPATPCIGADEVYTNLRVFLTPHNPPIQIPANGGRFLFDAEISNFTNAPIVFDGWTMTVLPNGIPYGPLVMRTNLTIQPGQTMMRIVTQNVPAMAPPGVYDYIGYAGVYPDSVINSDQFTFEKFAGDGAPAHNKGWLVEGWFGDETALSAIPTEYNLSNAYPNPFNPTTRINFTIPKASKVSLTVFDITGREVTTLVNGKVPVGHHSVIFDGEGLASGIYFYKLKADGYSDTKKMVLVK